MPLRTLYAEFDGVWRGRSEPDPLENQHNAILVLRLGQLTSVRNFFTTAFPEEIGSCVVITVHEAVTAFVFMTDKGAWDLPPDRVGIWNHDGGDVSDLGTLEEYLRSS
ncbi:unnamed protein product [Gemmataceae bacterium]|nr:unnamed protein product [Gemmataceae bacterium]VTU02743.1 unnamed protein product [Gemmataceae bacterium]